MAKNLSTLVSKAGIAQAAGGNAALQNTLTALADAAAATATKTNTSSKSAPNNSKATVSYQAPYYVVTFTDPGAGSTAASLAQAQAQAAASPLGANAVQSVIYHQVQSATSVLFDSPNHLTTYGGDSGSLQSVFLCDGLSATDQWYFRIRTSFDGVSWNQWTNINNGSAVIASKYAVTKTAIPGGAFLGITLPGQQVVGFGVGYLSSGELITSADGVLIENTLGIVGPASVNDVGDQAIGIQTCTAAATGAVTLLYRAASGASWAGGVNFLTFGWVAGGNQNLAELKLAATANVGGGYWVTVAVSGGCRFSVGAGVCTPTLNSFGLPPGLLPANVMAVATPASVIPPNGHDAHGIQQCDVTGVSPTLLYGDGSPRHNWSGTTNWFALAWEAPLNANVVQVAGGRWIILPTPSGKIAIGQGKTASGGIMPLPPGGYSHAQCLAFAGMDGYNDIGLYMHGVSVCTVDVGLGSSLGTCTGLYTNGTSNYWTGDLSWFAIAWL